MKKTVYFFTINKKKYVNLIYRVSEYSFIFITEFLETLIRKSKSKFSFSKQMLKVLLRFLRRDFFFLIFLKKKGISLVRTFYIYGPF